MHEKAAVLLHSIVRNHPLVDGNKRLGLARVIAFYGVNGFTLTLTLSNEKAYDLIMAVAAGELDQVADIAERLETCNWVGHSRLTPADPGGKPSVRDRLSVQGCYGRL